MDPFIGEVRMFAFAFAPKDWAICQGQIMPVAQNSQLFSVLGTYFGGNGTTTYGLPDLRDRVVLGAGQGRGLADYVIGKPGGEQLHTLVLNEMPLHTHAVDAYSGDASGADPRGATFMKGVWDDNAGHTTGVQVYNNTAAPTTQLALDVVSSVPGGGQPHNNLMPSLGLNFCIALQGIYPARN